MEVEQTALPGIGLRHDFATRDGRRIGVLSHRSGRRDLLLYDPDDPDRCEHTVPLTAEESDALAELLGAPRIVERLQQMHREVAGLTSEQVLITSGSPYDGRTLGDTQARTRTGASIVAVVREGAVHASPAPGFTFHAEDVVVVVGTADGTEAVASIFRDG